MESLELDRAFWLDLEAQGKVRVFVDLGGVLDRGYLLDISADGWAYRAWYPCLMAIYWGMVRLQPEVRRWVCNELA